MFMARYGRRGRPGTRPGSIEVPEGATAPHIRLVGFGPESISVLEECSLKDVARERNKHDVLWIDIAGLGDAAMIEECGKLFGIHRLSLEDLCHIPAAFQGRALSGLLIRCHAIANEASRIPTKFEMARNALSRLASLPARDL